MLLTIQIVLQAIAAFLIGTVVFDVLHFLFHHFTGSKYPLLRTIAKYHKIHHRFYSRTLQVNHEWKNKNLLYHVSVEYFSIMVGIASCLFIFNSIAIAIAACFETILFLGVLWCGGVDLHHKPHAKPPRVKGGIFVNAGYHALHHAHPKYFFSSTIKLLDYVLGTSHFLKGKKIAMTGTNGALGKHLKKLLEKEGATVTPFKYGVDYDYDSYEKLTKPLSEADILVLCHGSKYDFAEEANCDSYVRIIELYKSSRQAETPLEIWATGSEIECHPCFGIKKIKVYAASKRRYAQYARNYFKDENINYRHLVHSSFISQMGPGLMTAGFAAYVTLFLIKRGFKYVPVTYTGFAFLNYFRFLFNK